MVHAQHILLGKYIQNIVIEYVVNHYDLLYSEDEEEDRVAFPIVKESAGKLLETGINTLQKTLILKKEVEIDKVNAELQQKREEFKQRMEACSQRQIDIQKKQQKVRLIVLMSLYMSMEADILPIYEIDQNNLLWKYVTSPFIMFIAISGYCKTIKY